MTEVRSTLVPNYVEAAPADRVLDALHDAPTFTLNAAMVADAIGHPVRAVLNTLNQLRADLRVVRAVPCSEPDDVRNYYGFPAVWALPRDDDGPGAA